MSTDGPKGKPAASGPGKGPERKARLAAALRENLRRRKFQRNERKDAAAPPARDGDGA